MRKADLINGVYRAVGISANEAKIAVETIFDSIAKALHDAERTEIRGFGSFRTRKRGARIGRNPNTGAQVEVPSKTIAYFKPSKKLNEMIQSGKSETQL